MESTFIFFVKSSGLIGLFYLSYYILLRKETFFNSNRWFLLTGLLTSVVLPLAVFKKIVWVDPIPTNYDWSQIPVTASIKEEPFEINWYLVFAIIYSIGILMFLAKFAFDFYSLSKVLKGKTIQQQADFKFIDITENISPFSYFNSIVYNSSLYSETELENILEHEKIHSTQYHTVDVLISRLFCVVFWLNPLVWLYKKAIVQNLEFIADSEASKNISDKKAYQLTLLKITTHENCVAITNHFYQSLIKKRIVMLNKNQSNKRNSWKYAFVLPLLGAFVFFFQVKVIAQEKVAPKQEKGTDPKIENDFTTLSKGKEIYINGEKSSQEELGKLNPNEIEKIDVARVNNKEAILITPKQLIKPVKITDKDIYIDGVKSSNEEFSKLDQKNIDKIDINTFENSVRVTTKKITSQNENKIAEFEFLITKNTTDEEIKEKCLLIKDTYNIDLVIYNIKRNSNGEITNIECKDEGFLNGKKNIFSQTRNPIEPFIFYNNKSTNGRQSKVAFATSGNIISSTINNQSFDYKKAVILIDGELSDYQTLEKVNPKEVKQIVTTDINSSLPKNKKYFELYGEKAKYGILIALETKNYYDKNK